MLSRLLFGTAALVVLLCLAPRPAPAASSARKAYEQARRHYFALKDSKQRQQYRHNWMKVIAVFTEVASSFPDSEQAARAAYTVAELWSDLYRISRRGSDLDQALVAYERVVHNHPTSSLADDALWQRAEIYRRLLGNPEAAARAVHEILERYPSGDMVPLAREAAKTLPALSAPAAPAEDAEAQADGPLVGRREDAGDTPTVTSIKHWTNPGYSRVAIYLSGPAQARSGEVPKAEGKPARVFVDIKKAKLSAKVGGVTEANDQLLTQVRAAQFRPDTVRVVLDLERAVRHRVMVMENPYRVVVDAFLATEPPRAKQEASLVGRHVVIDPGHGGKDGGASGPGKIREKNVVLAIAKEVARLLAAKGIEVTMTRRGDASVALEERTAIANRLSADTFVSIHANANRTGKVRGIETYYLDVTDDRYALRLAAIENQTSEEQVSDLQLILADLATKVNTPESVALAKRVQSSLMKAIKGSNPEAKDLGVKPSLFYVLLGARMPAILVETGFLTNKSEGTLLGKGDYQRRLARAIAEAVIGHLKAPPPAAL